MPFLIAIEVGPMKEEIKAALQALIPAKPTPLPVLLLSPLILLKSDLSFYSQGLQLLPYLY